MRKIKILILAYTFSSLFLFQNCSQQDGGSSAWNQSAKNSSSGAPIIGGGQNFVATLSAPLGAVNVGISQNITAVVVGGVAPYSYVFTYTSNGSSSCMSGVAIHSSFTSLQCGFAYTSSGTVSVKVTDAVGAVASSQLVNVSIAGATPTPTSAATPTPTPVATPTPTPVATPTPTPVATPTPTPVAIPTPTPVVPNCAPITIGFTCSVQIFCPDGRFLGMGSQMQINTNFNVDATPGSVVACTTTNTVLVAGQTGLQNFKFTSPYFLTCSTAGAWTANGGVFCQVDVISAFDPSCAIERGGGD